MVLGVVPPHTHLMGSQTTPSHHAGYTSLHLTNQCFSSQTTPLLRSMLHHMQKCRMCMLPARSYERALGRYCDNGEPTTTEARPCIVQHTADCC